SCKSKKRLRMSTWDPPCGLLARVSQKAQMRSLTRPPFAQVAVLRVVEHELLPVIPTRLTNLPLFPTTAVHGCELAHGTPHSHAQCRIDLGHKSRLPESRRSESPSARELPAGSHHNQSRVLYPTP